VTFGVTNYDTTTGNCLSGGCELTIEIEDTSPQAANSNPDMLDGLYFNIRQGTTSSQTAGTSPGGLALVSAAAPDGLINATGNTITTGSAGANICAPGGGTGVVTPLCAPTVSGGWQSAYNTSGLGGGMSAKQVWGIGTTGQGGVFKGQAVGTFDYTILSSAGVGSKETVYPFVFDKADFVLTTLTSSNIYVWNVAATYGTGPDFVIPTMYVSGETPEPRTFVMISGAVLVLMMKRRRRVRY